MSSMLLAAAAATVNPAPTITAEQALENARAALSAAPRKAAPCPDARGDEIVVCAEQEDPAKQYVSSNTDSGDTDDGTPHAPDVSGMPQCPSEGFTFSGSLSFCAKHLGKQPRQLYIIDLKAIPEAPAGSDADKIAKGEMATP
jgi:hypothetical protein